MKTEKCQDISEYFFKDMEAKNKKNLLKVAGIGLTTAALAACAAQVINGQSTDSNLPSETAIANAGTPFPEGALIGQSEIGLVAEQDSKVVATEVASFNQAEVDWYDEGGNLQTSLSGKDSGFTLLGVLSARPTNNGAESYGTFGYVTSAGGEEHIVQKIDNDRWIVLAFKELPSPDGNVLNSFGYPSQGIFLPILSAEYTASGDPTGTRWFFDISANKFYKIRGQEDGISKPGVFVLAQIGNEHILQGRDLMENDPDVFWNFAWQSDGSLTIVTGAKEVLYTYNSESKTWIEKVATPNPENIQKIESLTELKMIMSPNGEYYVFSGDKEEIYKVYAKGGKYDELSWEIEEEMVVFKNLTQDIVNKGTDTDGNKVSWIQGFSVTKDKDTGEISYDLVATSGMEKTGTPSENNPHFAFFDKGTPEYKIQEENVLMYFKAVEEIYPPENLFVTGLEDEMTGSYEVSDAYAVGALDIQLFFPMSTQGQFLWSAHSNNSYNGKDAEPLIDGDLTGNYSPYQFAREGAIYRKVAEGWGMLYWPLYIKQVDGSVVRIITVEDEITASGTPINQIYSGFGPSDNVIPVQFAPNNRNATRASSGTAFSPAMSIRMGNWYVENVNPVNFNSRKLSGKNVMFKDWPFDNEFVIDSLPENINGHIFLIFSGASKINK